MTYWHTKMIQRIINEGYYEFEGSIDNFKKCISSFRVTKVLCDGNIQGIVLLEVLGRFKYHSTWHKVSISKDWSGKDKLYIEYQGETK